MELFFLVRHGAAQATSPRGDAGRALSPEGRAQFTALASALAPKLGLRRVVTSPATRARETAEILARAADVELEELDALAPAESSAGRLLALGRQYGAGTALVGHNPEIAEAVALAARGPHPIVPGTVAAIELVEGGVRLAWLKAP